ncbi:MAG: domain superfamily [Acidobacteriaceae bacterium]|jgi:hypothetical protein|nr:domain superfamily [Acidobacteriaceae bacterium]
MKYLCQIFYDEKNLNNLSEGELSNLVDESLDYNERLRVGQHLVAAQALELVSAAKTVRMRSGELLITDGPFAETREHIGGFILIDAKDMDEAVQLASRIPSVRLGGVEVRPVKELTRTSQKQASS